MNPPPDAHPTMDTGATELRAGTLADALARRSGGTRHAVGTDAADPVEALWRTAQELYGLLSVLDDEQWVRPTTTSYGRVKDLVAHLAAIERYTVDLLAGRLGDDPLDHAHVLLGHDLIAELADAPGATVADRWFDAAADSCETLASLAPGSPVTMHGITVDRDLALVFRTFELWAHHEDVAAAVGAPLPRLDGPRMGLMASGLVGVLPLLFGDPAPSQVGRRVRLVLLGPGGGVVDLALDPAVDLADDRPADARLVADVVDFCRVASRRLPIDALEHRDTGEVELLRPVLEAAAAFAMD